MYVKVKNMCSSAALFNTAAYIISAALKQTIHTFNQYV